MLMLTRRPGQSILIELSPDVDPATPVGDLLPDGIEAPLEITVLGEEIA